MARAWTADKISLLLLACKASCSGRRAGGGEIISEPGPTSMSRGVSSPIRFRAAAARLLAAASRCG